jgi:hypothetical protein
VIRADELLSVSRADFNVSMAFRGPPGMDGVHAAGANCRDMPVAADEKPTPVALTGKQKVALMLEKAGYSHAVIAEKLGLKHRQSATELLARARAAEKAWKAAIVDFIGNP